MIWTSALVFSILSVSWGLEEKTQELSFPPRFQFGVASSSYQIEGAWNISGKGESIWDRFTHNGTPDNGDVACDSYHLWRRDVEMVQELGVHFYRFSISWARILPQGFTNHVNAEGTKYYSDLIDALLEKGIEPVVTMYHWDLPQRLQDLGGWANPLISKWFADYSRLVFSLYADRVKSWITINEPLIICDLPYQYAILAPGVINPEGSLMCSKNVLMAHAKAWRIYDEEYRPKYNGRVTLTNFEMWLQPESEEDQSVAELARQNFALYTKPIFSKEGGWPPAVEKAIAQYSKKLGYPRSILPSLSEEEVKLLKGTYDFYAVNYYTSRTIRRANESEVLEPWPIGDVPHLTAKLGHDPSWETTATSFYPIYPEGLRKQLNWIKQQYGDIPIMIAENGFGSKGGLDDKDRIVYFRKHLKQVLLAIKDGVNVTAFTVWSLMDSFEWMDGYNSKYGLYEVDFSSSDKKRTPRASVFYYTSVIRNKSLNVTEIINLSSTITHVTTLIAEKTDYSQPLIIGGTLLGVAIIAVAVVLVRRKLTSRTDKSAYTGVHTEERS